MENKTLYGIMCILFNCIGVPSFMQGDTRTGIIRIITTILYIPLFPIFMFNLISGIVDGINVLTMSDEEYKDNKVTCEGLTFKYNGSSFSM